MSNKILGCLSEKYESNNNPGAISHYQGDYGNRTGGSYGCYQMIATTVSIYLNFIKLKYPAFYNRLIKYSIGSKEFDTQWKSIATTSPTLFKESQWVFIKASYYDVFVNRIKIKYGFDINKRSFALMNSVWSLTVQFGTGNKIFDIVYKPGISDKNLITALYAERGENNGKKYFGKSSESVQKSVCNRFKNELNDALQLLNEENKPQPIKEVDVVTQEEAEIVRSLAVTIERISTNQPIAEQINYIKEKFDGYLKNGGK